MYSPVCRWYDLCYPFGSSNNATLSLTEDQLTVVSWDLVREWFTWFMHAWNMPMFFYLSGQNCYSALFRRTKTQFREERVHRLIVPTLFMSTVKLPFTLSYFAPHNETLELSYGSTVQRFYQYPGIHQCWFLAYLFLYSQMFAHCFIAVHPKTSAAASGRFLSAVTQYLKGPIKLVFIPALVLSVLEISNHVIPWWWFRLFPFFFYMTIYVLGYIMAAGDEHFHPITTRWSWVYILAGTALCVGYGVLTVVSSVMCDTMPVPPPDLLSNSTSPVLKALVVEKGILRGFGQWLFLLGLISVMRQRCFRARAWHRTCREMAMPFYLCHMQVLVMFVSGALWVPYLRTLPLVLIFTTVLTAGISFLITKSGPLRYLFGLPPPRGSCLPGEKLRGFVPVLVLSILVLLHILLANLL